jgi:hypothetical protein
MTTINVFGKGDYTLEIIDGNLRVSFGGATLFSTKGNPTKPNNPSFSSLEEASAYFLTTSHGQPLGLTPEQLATEGNENA